MTTACLQRARSSSIRVGAMENMDCRQFPSLNSIFKAHVASRSMGFRASLKTTRIFAFSMSLSLKEMARGPSSYEGWVLKGGKV